MSNDGQQHDAQDGEPDGPEAVRTSLLRELDAVDRRLASLDAEFDDIVAGSELVNTDDEHDPEGATIAFERAQVASLRDGASRQRASIDAALRALDDGTYGICVGCGAPIGAERLDAVPGTELCVRCAGAARR